MNRDAHQEYIAKELLLILKASIEEELAANKRYRRGAELAINPEVKELLESLAMEEEKHAMGLRYKLREIVKKMRLEDLLPEIEKLV